MRAGFGLSSSAVAAGILWQHDAKRRGEMP